MKTNQRRQLGARISSVSKKSVIGFRFNFRYTCRSTLLVVLIAVLFLKDRNGVPSGVMGPSLQNRFHSFGAYGFATTSTNVWKTETSLRNRKRQEMEMRILRPDKRLIGGRMNPFLVEPFTALQSSLNHDHGEGNCLLPTVRTAIQSSLAVFAAILFSMGGSLPAIAHSDHLPLTTQIQSSTVLLSSNTETIEMNDLIKSLSPATESRPQIPFPTEQALKAAESAAAGSAASSSATTNLLKQRPQLPIPQENLLQENSYSLPALVSLDSGLQKLRPYNGADVLVLQVWTDRPPQQQSDTDNSSSNTPTILGGAKIPIGAVVGGFPVRVSLGPQNAVSDAAADKTNNNEASQQRWKEYLSSQSLWVRGAVCRAGSGSDYAAPNAACSSDYPQPILEGIGFSKFINLSSLQQQAQLPGNGNGVGLRAPVSLVLDVPVR